MGKFNYSLAYLTWILLGLLPSLGKLYILTNCKIIKTRPRTFFRHMVIKIVRKVWTLGNYNYASITFVDRLIRKSIANSAFALSLILESKTGSWVSWGLLVFVQKSVREILSCDDDTQKMKIQSYFSEIVSKHISIFEEIKCVHSTKNSTISVSAFLTQYRNIAY